MVNKKGSIPGKSSDKHDKFAAHMRAMDVKTSRRIRTLSSFGWLVAGRYAESTKRATCENARKLMDWSGCLFEPFRSVVEHVACAIVTWQDATYTFDGSDEFDGFKISIKFFAGNDGFKMTYNAGDVAVVSDVSFSNKTRSMAVCSPKTVGRKVKINQDGTTMNDGFVMWS